ncbi:sensor histidine kinase [Curtobacterium sp. Leaf261]|uniref:sensor histidine kinase n=1 Tax=Curtobacterium sp. Leaf261 TaxID=1736311 RepID=UPI0006F7BC61|nr:histidine kinase [Curtobacterium sp. Leaf261]KQO63658.1 hypothetical protein ASF23_05375 [Curtobacterium sp. Leaf261]
MIHDPRATSALDPVTGRERTSLGLALNLIGLAVVVFWFVTLAPGRSATVLVLGGVALVAWLVRQVLRAPVLRLVCALLMVVLGALTMEPTDALTIAPVIAAVIALEADHDLPPWLGGASAFAAAVIASVGAALAASSIGYLLGALGGIGIALLVGYSRRQARAAELQRTELAERQREAEREQERAALFADRARVARDVHDVLAHSLGGLVLQLDAVEALLEAGRVDDAAGRAGAARALAADGLAEARRAVATLRDPAEQATPVTVGAAEPATVRTGGAPPARIARSRPEPVGSGGLEDLVDAHRSFGGVVSVEGDVRLAEVDGRHRETLVMATREALSNARKHAPGAPVTLVIARVDGSGRSVGVSVSNPVALPGHGLLGIRERFAELDDGSSVEVASSADAFVVSMRVPVTPDDRESRS